MGKKIVSKHTKGTGVGLCLLLLVCCVSTVQPPQKSQR